MYEYGRCYYCGWTYPLTRDDQGRPWDMDWAGNLRCEICDRDWRETGRDGGLELPPVTRARTEHDI